MLQCEMIIDAAAVFLLSQEKGQQNHRFHTQHCDLSESLGLNKESLPLYGMRHFG
jgi:hypothetical protein